MIEKMQHQQVRTGQCEHHIRNGRALLAFFIFIFAAVLSGRAQLTTADIVGTVTDGSGAVIAGAQVQLQNTETHDQRVAVTNSSGDYQFTQLHSGHYVLSVKFSGFKTSTTSDLAVESGDRARADVQMQTGGQTETVTVEAQTPLLQADNATVSSTVTAKAVQDLPLNGRNFVQLVQLVPGANEGPGNGLTSGGRPDDRRSTSGFSVNGQDDTLNNYVIDGLDNNERIIGTIGVKPSVEGIQEISVQTNSYAAEAGRTAGGVVNLVTKSGTNTFHGTAYEFFRNDIFDARNVYQTTGRKPELRQNQYGGSIGGPIFKNRTFFFGDYEGYRQVSGTTYRSTVPTIDEYNNINSIGTGSPAALVAAGNGTAGYAIDPIALAYLKLFPAPNAPGLANNFVISPNRTQYSNLFDVRVDHRFNDRNLFFARYSYNKVDTNTPSALGIAPNGLDISGGRYIFAGPATDSGQQYAFNYTHIFNQNLLVDLKAAFTRVNNLSLPLNYGKNPDTTLGFGSNMNFNALSSFLTPIQFGPFSDIGDGAYVPLQDIDNTFQYLGTVSYTIGNHNIKAGASFIRRQSRNVQSSFAAGQYTFGLSSDNDADKKKTQDNNLASSLVGAFSAASRNYDLFPPDYRTYEPSGFAQDSWKATRRLTLLFGVRYDVFTPFTEAHNRISNFDFNQATGLNSSTIASALKVAGANGVSSTAGIKTDYSNVAPRLGFAASLTPTIVLRGGYGLSFFPGNYTSNANLKNAPFVSVYSPNCQSSIAYQIQTSPATQNKPSTVNPDCATIPGAATAFSQGLPLPAAQTINSNALSFVAENPNFRSALIQQFNLQVEQQFGANVLTIGYVGNIGQHLPEEINDINVPTPAAVFAGLNAVTPTTAPRPLSAGLSNLGQVSWLNSGGISNYNGLQTSFQRRFTKGLAFDANYTWAKAMSDVTGFSEEGQQGWSNADPTRIRQTEYGIAENNIGSRFALSLNYELQYGKNFTGVKGFALAGWQANTIAVWQGGKPFTIINSSNAGGFSNRASPIFNGGSDRPNQIHGTSLSHKTNDEFFDITAFAPQTLGTVGSTHRNSLTGPHFRHIDLSLFKTFPITERFRVQFRAEAFDLSNTPNFYINNNGGNSSTQLGNSAFGTVAQTDPNYVPRQLQFALKLQF
ncbi:TonB-dependent receptor [Granulicella sp. dw_53]|uniref:TonB-dependent receptor n=1 Tax=Granulicella sp. dw_53 TaxID=2719792 RepID=UPI001BD4E667|nr:TonB-dependent receptor [Granulicella sp. dw_53]